jgi:hypothetical protein
MDNLSAIYFRFMASRPGRLMRGAVGATMIIGGFAAEPPGGLYYAAAGMLPLVAAVLDLCLLAPIWGLPLMGTELRRKLSGPTVKVRGPQAG